MQVTYEFQLDDLRALERFSKAKRSGRARSHAFWLMVWFVSTLPTLLGIVSGLRSPTFAATWKTNPLAALVPLSFWLLPLGFLALLWFGAPLLQPMGFRSSPLWKKQMTLSPAKEGLRGSSVLWSQVTSIEETPTHFFVLFEPNQALIIPKRAFSSDFAATQFISSCRDLWQETQTKVAKSSLD